MSGSQIRYEAKERTKQNFDSLYFPSVFGSLIATVGKFVPVFGDAFTAPFKLHIFELCTNPEDYPRFTFKDFSKYFKSHWNVCLGYAARCAYYVAFPAIFLFLGIFFLMTALPGLILNAGGYRALGAIGVLEGICVLGIIATIVFMLYRTYKTVFGVYVIFRNPGIKSDDALNMSIQLSKGHLLDYIGMHICLIPQYILVILAGYGNPFIETAFTMYYENIYNEANVGAQENVCPSCGKPVTPGSKFCGSCGHDLSK